MEASKATHESNRLTLAYTSQPMIQIQTGTCLLNGRTVDPYSTNQHLKQQHSTGATYWTPSQLSHGKQSSSSSSSGCTAGGLQAITACPWK
jgi:hypothetical protein